MKWKINLSALERNIEKARLLVNKPIALMFKDFYQCIYPNLNLHDVRCFGISIPNSICYSLGKATAMNDGALVISKNEVRRCLDLGLRTLYIPINAHDNREGLSVSNAINLLRDIRSECNGIELVGLVTSGCLNEKHPNIDELWSLWYQLGSFLNGFSLGGSFWLGQSVPDFVTEVRIGEYMLFGTIPYYTGDREGDNGIEIETSVLAIYPERGQIIVDCGYSLADMKDCKPIEAGITVIDCSSEYTILETRREFNAGETIRFVPNYKSLVKMRHGRIDFIRE